MGNWRLLMSRIGLKIYLLLGTLGDRTCTR
jgi:hypothetical protein